MLRTVPLLVVAACATSLSMLTRIDPEFAGANCEEGGLAVHEGTDADRDANLDDDEIERTTYLCHGDEPIEVEGLHQGHLVVRNAQELAALEGIDTITGDLLLMGVQLDSVTISGVRAVGGRVYVGDSHFGTLLTRVELPDLAWVGGGVVLENNPLLEAFVAPQLAAASESLELRLDDNPKLTDVSGLMGLTEVGSFEIEGDNRGVVLASLPLVAVGTLSIRGRVAGDLDFDSLLVADAIALQPEGIDSVSANFASMTAAGSVSVADADLLTALSMPELHTVRGDFLMHRDNALVDLDLSRLTWVTGHFELINSNALVELDLPALDTVEGRLKLQDSDGLTDIRLSSLETVGGSTWVTRHGALERLDLGSLQQAGTWKTLVFAIELNTALDEITHSGDPLAVDAWFVVSGNSALPDLDVFMAVTGVTGDFTIQDNALIDGCDAQALLDSVGEANIEGTVTIEVCEP